MRRLLMTVVGQTREGGDVRRAALSRQELVQYRDCISTGKGTKIAMTIKSASKFLELFRLHFD
jgi:hypothetical protein